MNFFKQIKEKRQNRPFWLVSETLKNQKKDLLMKM